jgi:DNA adenine methylase
MTATPITIATAINAIYGRHEQAPRRPIGRYHGGKWKLAPWIIGHMPPHTCYCEPYCGLGSVCLRKPRVTAEILNDLDGDVVNVLRVLRDRRDEILRAVVLTPFSREEYDIAHEPAFDPLERARRWLLRTAAAFGSSGTGKQGHRTGFRNDANSRRQAAWDWANLPEQLSVVIERLRGILIERMPALEVIEMYDRPEMLFLVDPPYVHETRSSRMKWAGRGYRHEMTDSDHVALARALHSVRGMAMICGYASPLYQDLYAGWECFTKDSQILRRPRSSAGGPVYGAAKRTEHLWLNPAASAARATQPTDLFSPSQEEEPNL